MSDIPRSTSSGRRTAAVCALVAVTARVASIFLWPPDADASHARMLASAAAHRAAWNAATAAETVAWITAGCAVLAATALVAGRGRLPARLGGWWYGASLITLGFVGGAMNSVTAVLARQPDRALMVRIQGDLHAPVLNAFVTVVLLGELLLVVFAVGLSRARLTGWWFVALSALALVGYVATADSSNHLVVLAGFLPLGATWLVLAGLLSSAPVPALRTTPEAALVA